MKTIFGATNGTHIVGEIKNEMDTMMKRLTLTPTPERNISNIGSL